MIPPTSIDGTDITGATIDGTDVQEITVDGDTVFTAGPTIIDDFDANDFTTKWNINGTAGSFTGFNATTSNVHDGSHSLRIDSNNNNSVFLDSSQSVSTPSFGDTHEFYFDADASTHVFVTWLSDKVGAQFDIPRGHFIEFNSRVPRVQLGITSANDARAAVSDSPITLTGYHRVLINYINSNSELQAEIFDLNDNLVFSETVNTINTGFGSSCAVHSRFDGPNFLDSWTLP